ncbi:MAG: MFS transporter [Micromonosporaceae bacterium]|nr:MFS transporter [Micromonosporaceae bacterium]
MHRLRRDRVTWLIYAQLAIWAYFLYGLGPVVPLLRDEQHVSRAVASLHSTALAAGGVLAGAAYPALARRFGRPVLMWAGLAGIAAAVAAFCLVRPVVVTIAAVLVASWFASLLLTGVVLSLDQLHAPVGHAAFAEANALACAAGAVAPLLVGLTVHSGLTWRPAIALVPVLALMAWFARAPLPPAAGTGPAVTAPGTAAGGPVGRLPGRFWLAWVLLCMTGSVEMCVNLWSGDLLRTHAHLSPDAAASAISGIVGGMALGRLIGGRVALRVAAPQLLLAVLAVSAAGVAVLWSSTVPWLALAGLVITGLGNGMHYPLGMALALQSSGGRPDQAAARTLYSTAVAFGISPLALGAIADQVGTRLAFLLVPVFLLAAAGLAARLRLVVPAPAAATWGSATAQ